LKKRRWSYQDELTYQVKHKQVSITNEYCGTKFNRVGDINGERVYHAHAKYCVGKKIIQFGGGGFFCYDNESELVLFFSKNMPQGEPVSQNKATCRCHIQQK
jgi:hypothetical protein